MATTTLGYLIPELRLTIGDITPSTYRYDNDWLRVALLASIKALERWWNYRYLVDGNNEVYRNPNISFHTPEPPVILTGDERVIILQAAIIILRGDLQNVAWNLAAWKDAEISYSNLEGGRTKRDVIKDLWEELKSLITPPTKRLAKPVKGSLPGFLNNQYERDIKDLG